MVTKLVPLKVSELLQLETPPLEWHVEGLIPVGSLALLSAREKSGKGLFGIDLAASIAEGKPFLGLETTQGKAVYVAAEEPIDLLQERVRNRLGDCQDAPFHLAHLNGTTEGTLNLTKESDAMELDSFVVEHNVEFLILDVLRELHSAQEDSSTEMGPVMKVLRNIAHNRRCTIVVTHHDSKGGGARGSTAITAGVDETIQMTTNTDSGRLEGSINAKGRHVPLIEMSITFDGQSRWTGAISKGGKPLAKTTAADRIVRALLQEDWPRDVNEIVRITKMKRSTVANSMTKLKSDFPGFILETPGKGTGSAPKYQVDRQRIPQHFAAAQ